MGYLFKLKKEKAFTLIELLVVIAIIGILAAVVVVNLGSARAKARDAKRMSDVSKIQTAMELYYDKNGSYYSEDVKNKDCHAIGFDSYTNYVFEDLVGAGFLSSAPKDPAEDTNNGFFYAVSCAGSGSGYAVRAKLENGGSSILQGDFDGVYNELHCDDPFYCVKGGD